MTDVQHPKTMGELRQVMAEHPFVLPIGNRTKPGCSLVLAYENEDPNQPTLVSLTGLSGIIEYEPSEFTFTAHAGTRVSEIAEALKKENQYLPFDPLLVKTGATLGGTVASNAAGPGRFRYGGVRDFLLAVCLVTGDGETIRAGAKVVKNSAGFDIPKLMVGSLGRLGIMTELTFKVFPRQRSQTTLRIQCGSHAEAIDTISAAAHSRWELDAIDYRNHEQAVFCRIAGHEQSNELIACEMLDRWKGDAVALSGERSRLFWTSVRELNFGGAGAIIAKVPTTTTSFLEMTCAFADNPKIEMHLSVAGSLTWLAIKSETAILEVDETLQRLSLVGLVVRGAADRMWLGQREDRVIDHSIKQAMDPVGKFPGF
jgi:glycolate oxidase FAD binding subunit